MPTGVNRQKVESADCPSVQASLTSAHRCSLHPKWRPEELSAELCWNSQKFPANPLEVGPNSTKQQTCLTCHSMNFTPLQGHFRLDSGCARPSTKSTPGPTLVAGFRPSPGVSTWGTFRRHPDCKNALWSDNWQQIPHCQNSISFQVQFLKVFTLSEHVAVHRFHGVMAQVQPGQMLQFVEHMLVGLPKINLIIFYVLKIAKRCFMFMSKVRKKFSPVGVSIP